MAAFFFARSIRLSGALLMATTLNYAVAAELGEAVVRSHIGQHLVADIELTGMSDAAVPVQVRLASADVYRGANISMPPILRSLHMSVMRRDGRQFLHVISTAPVQREHVNLFLDLNDGSRRHLRQITLWLTPNPTPAPAVVAAAPAVIAAAPVAAVVAPSVPHKAPARIVTRAAPPARLQASAPPACPEVSEEALRTCAALDQQNGMLQARIVELEGKVTALKLAIGSGRAGPAPANKPSAPLAAPPQAGFQWLLVGAAVAALALIGALAVYMRRRKAELKGAPPAPFPTPWLARLKARLRPNRSPTETKEVAAAE